MTNQPMTQGYVGAKLAPLKLIAGTPTPMFLGAVVEGEDVTFFFAQEDPRRSEHIGRFPVAVVVAGGTLYGDDGANIGYSSDRHQYWAYSGDKGETYVIERADMLELVGVVMTIDYGHGA